MKNLKNNLLKLRVLLLCNCKLRKQMIKYGDKEFIHAIIECIDNYLRGNIPYSKSKIKSLLKYKKTLLKIVEKNSEKESRNLLEKGVQKGGFLQLILGPAISALSSILGTIISKKINNSE